MECFDKQSRDNNQKQNKSMRLNLNLRSKTRKNASTRKIAQKRQTQEMDESYMGKHAASSSPMAERESTAPTQTTPKLTVFRKHFVDQAEITEIRDLNTGVSEFRGKSNIKYVMDDFNEIMMMGDFLVNVSPMSNSYRQTDWKGLYGEERHCQCQRSSCRQNYCICYQGGFKCGNFCQCNNCKNISVPISRSEELVQTKREARQANPVGIGQFYLPNEPITDRSSQRRRETPHYCKCKRTENCQKSYCGCFRLGINCSKECKCENCEN